MKMIKNMVIPEIRVKNENQKLHVKDYKGKKIKLDFLLRINNLVNNI